MRNGVRRIPLVLWVIAVLAVGSSSAFAQTQTPPPPPPQSQSSGGHAGFGIQIAGGPLFANLTDAGALKTGSKTGWLVGVAMGGNRGGNVGVEADVLYGQKGATVDTKDFDQHIIDVPVMIKWNFGSSNVNGLSVFGLAGGFFDWQFNSKLAGVDISKDTDGYEVGYVFGVGVEVLRFSVQGRYIRGVREINRGLTAANPVGDAKAQTFAILLAFRLN